MAGNVRLNLKPLLEFRNNMRREIAVGSPDDMFTSWGRRYLAFLRERFRRNRAGGGDWPALAASTLKKHVPRLGILYVTGAIFNALRPGQPGNVFRRIRNGIQVGFGGGAKHPDSKATIAQIAAWQNRGTGTIPQRKIIVPPDQALAHLMREDAKRAVQRAMREAGR